MSKEVTTLIKKRFAISCNRLLDKGVRERSSLHGEFKSENRILKKPAVITTVAFPDLSKPLALQKCLTRLKCVKYDNVTALCILRPTKSADTKCLHMFSGKFPHPAI